jgi:ABC-type antimicrobial peptide transport system permease subunit
MLTGLTTESWTSEFDMVIVKTDSMGNELWSKTLGGNSYDVGNTILQTVDNNYILTGSLDSDLCVLKNK